MHGQQNIKKLLITNYFKLLCNQAIDFFPRLYIKKILH